MNTRLKGFWNYIKSCYEEIYIEVPVGLNEVYVNANNEENTSFLLKKGKYGLCQAARQLWKKFVEEMSKLDFETSPVDPCLLIEKMNLEHA